MLNANRNIAACFLCALLLAGCGAASGTSSTQGQTEQAGGSAETVDISSASGDGSGASGSAGATTSEEVIPPAESLPVGAVTDRLDFSTVSTDGEALGSADLFAEHKVTMINFWASWCPPCVAELPDLESLAAELAEKDCGIVGVLIDGYEGTGLVDGLEIMEKSGVTYPNILPWENFGQDVAFYAVPTTMFVNSEGAFVGQSVIGASIDAYREAIDAILATGQ